MTLYEPIEKPTKQDLFDLARLLEAKVSVSERPRSITITVPNQRQQEFSALKPAFDYVSMIHRKGVEYWPTVDTAAREAIARRDRQRHPPGKFDNAGRFYASERCECCLSIKSPSRTHPFLQMVHARTMTHVAQVFDVALPHLRARVREIDLGTAPQVRLS